MISGDDFEKNWETSWQIHCDETKMGGNQIGIKERIYNSVGGNQYH